MSSFDKPPVFGSPPAQRPTDRTGCIVGAVLAAAIGLPVLLVLGVVALGVVVALVHRNEAGNAGPNGGGIAHVTDDTFDREVLNEAVPGPILVDFYADWCGPCRSQATILNRFAAQNPGVTVVKVDIDENEELASRYNVEAIPTLLIVKRGKVIARHTGLASEAELKKMLRGESAAGPAL